MGWIAFMNHAERCFVTLCSIVNALIVVALL